MCWMSRRPASASPATRSQPFSSPPVRRGGWMQLTVPQALGDLPRFVSKEPGSVHIGGTNRWITVSAQQYRQRPRSAAPAVLTGDRAHQRTLTRALPPKPLPHYTSEYRRAFKQRMPGEIHPLGIRTEEWSKSDRRQTSPILCACSCTVDLLLCLDERSLMKAS